MTAVPLRDLGDRLTPEAAEIADLIDRFVDDAPSADALVLIDRHGLPILWTGSLAEETTDHIAAVMLGLGSMADALAQSLAGHRGERLLLELDSEFVFVERAGDHATLGVIADKRTDLGAIGYEVALLGARLAGRLDENIVGELVGRIGRS